MVDGGGLENRFTRKRNGGSNPPPSVWRSGRVVEGGRLESDYTCKGIGGSNPPSSVISSCSFVV